MRTWQDLQGTGTRQLAIEHAPNSSHGGPATHVPPETTSFQSLPLSFFIFTLFFVFFVIFIIFVFFIIFVVVVVFFCSFFCWMSSTGLSQSMSLTE